jgi:hypothetical protein
MQAAFSICQQLHPAEKSTVFLRSVQIPCTFNAVPLTEPFTLWCVLQLKENLQAFNVVLPPEAVDDINAIYKKFRDPPTAA